MGRQKIKTELLVHDLKGPLAVIETGIISLLEREKKYGPLTEKQQKVLLRALRNTKITRTLVNDALEVGRSTEGIINKNKFCISNFIKQSLVEIFDLTDYNTAENIKECTTLSPLKKALLKKGIMLEIDAALWLQEVWLDECKMRQILRNLLNNALKYRNEHVELMIKKDDRSIFISVGDDGDGIPENYHQKIFDCYFQMETERDHCIRGHGLGLAGVMVLVEDMGGNLSLESSEGKGARFSVKIPLDVP
jgi:signal transduction histidine kinase